MASSSPSLFSISIFPSPPPFLASSGAKLVSLETLSASSEALSMSRNCKGSSSTAKPSTISIFSRSKSGVCSFLEIFGHGFFKICSLDFKKSLMHTSFSSRFLAVSAFARHQRSAHPITTRRCVFNTRLRVDLTRGRVSPTRRHVRPLPRCSTSTHRSSGSLSSSWARASLTILPLLVYGHFTMLFSLLLLSVTLLCLLSVTCLCWFLLTPIQLGFELLISVVSFWFLFGNLFSTVTVHLNLHDFCESLFRCFNGVLVLPMVSSIKMRRGKGFLGLHPQLFLLITRCEEFVIFWIGLICLKQYSFICLSCNFLIPMF
jgi:hypothetical protein